MFANSNGGTIQSTLQVKSERLYPALKEKKRIQIEHKTLSPLLALSQLHRTNQVCVARPGISRRPGIGSVRIGSVLCCGTVCCELRFELVSVSVSALL